MRNPLWAMKVTHCTVRHDGVTVNKSDVDLENDFVVPYNPTLLCEYLAHINIEWCNKNKSIKYLFKYINKGTYRNVYFSFPLYDPSNDIICETQHD
ncbi:hypothetical protein ACS0TY_030389 [Phlomoides rotata]